ncbi:MAG: hybrid sensor histidine kinase/response regulator [Pseudomonadota bacterium]
MNERIEASEQLERHALRMLLNRSFDAYAMHVVVAGLLAAYMAPAIPIWRSVLFFMGLATGLALQFKLARIESSEDWDKKTFLSVRNTFDGAAIWVGLMWGFAGFFLFPSDDQTRQIFLTFVMGGMSLSAVGTQGMRLRTCYSSIIPGLLPLGLAYMSLGTISGLLSGGLIFAYLFVLVMLARKINEFMLQAFRLQLEKDDLLDELKHQADALKLAQHDAEDANLAKSRFLAQASHDLRQPLHAISLFVEALPDAETEDDRNKILARTRQSLDVLSKLFDSLLDVTLLDTGGLEVRPDLFRISDIIEDVVGDFALVAEGCNVSLSHVPTSLIVRSDPVLVRRMLQNLVSNAIRYSEGGRVLVGCRRHGDRLSLNVIDTGQGIKDADRARIFGEFTRLDTHRMGASATPGLGLGLSIVKRIANAIDLDVRVQSVYGRGSSFVIGGFERAFNMTPLKRQRPATAGVVEGASVFVLDDDPETLAATEVLLRRWGCNVETSQAPEALISATPDVIICDYEISPSLTGLDVLDQLTRQRTECPPAVMISGHTSRALRSAAQQRGIPLIHKPVRPAQLRSALLNALAKSDQAARRREGRRR